MSALVEWTSGVLRAGPNFKQYGDPYTFVCTLIRHGDTVTIVGACGEISAETYRAIEAELRRQGVKSAKWERRIDGKQPRNFEKGKT